MNNFLKFILIVAVIITVGWFVWDRFEPKSKVESNHQVLLERIESMGKLELVKYRFSDVLEHKNINTYLPDASVLLIIKADAVGCIDLTKLKKEDIYTNKDSASIKLPRAEICYVKIDHKASKVYDTKMAFFREGQLVGEAFRSAEQEITRQVKNSDILKQTESNARHVLKPLLEGLGFTKVSFRFE